MSREFSVEHQGRALKVCVVPIDEAWQFCLCERDCRVKMAATLPIDEAVPFWRQGLDPIEATLSSISDRLKSGELPVPAEGVGPCACRRAGHSRRAILDGKRAIG